MKTEDTDVLRRVYKNSTETVLLIVPFCQIIITCGQEEGKVTQKDTF